MLAVIKYNSTDQPDIVGTMWKVLHTGNPRLGVELAEKKQKIYNARCDVGPGLNKRAVKDQSLPGMLCRCHGTLVCIRRMSGISYC